MNCGVRAILQDRSGDYWFGSHVEGVCRVGRDGVRHFTRADGPSDDQVRAIQEAPDGSIWFDNGIGVSRFDGERFTTPVDREHSPLPTRALAPDDLWFKSSGSTGFDAREREEGVHRMHGGRLTYLALPLPEPLRSDDGYSVTGFAEGKGGRIWIATYNAVFGLDGASFTTIDGARMGLREGEGMPHVRCVFEDSRGRVWIGTIGGGAWRYDGRGLRRFSASDGLTSASVMAIYCDLDGVLWLGGTEVFRFDGSRFERVH